MGSTSTPSRVFFPFPGANAHSRGGLSYRAVWWPLWTSRCLARRSCWPWHPHCSQDSGLMTPLPGVGLGSHSASPGADCMEPQGHLEQSLLRAPCHLLCAWLPEVAELPVWSGWDPERRPWQRAVEDGQPGLPSGTAVAKIPCGLPCPCSHCHCGRPPGTPQGCADLHSCGNRRGVRCWSEELGEAGVQGRPFWPARCPEV